MGPYSLSSATAKTYDFDLMPCLSDMSLHAEFVCVSAPQKLVQAYRCPTEPQTFDDAAHHGYRMCPNIVRDHPGTHTHI